MRRRQMTGSEMKAAAIELFGEAGWRSRLAEALDIDRAQPARWMELDRVPGPAAAAIRCWLRERRERGGCQIE